MVAIPNRAIGARVEAAAAAAGYQAKVSQDGDSGDWTCYCSKTMVATYDSVVACQRELDTLAKPLGGHVDGWGTFGNVNDR